MNASDSGKVRANHIDGWPQNNYRDSKNRAKKSQAGEYSLCSDGIGIDHNIKFAYYSRIIETFDLSRSI